MNLKIARVERRPIKNRILCCRCCRLSCGGSCGIAVDTRRRDRGGARAGGPGTRVSEQNPAALRLAFLSCCPALASLARPECALAGCDAGGYEQGARPDREGGVEVPGKSSRGFSRIHPAPNANRHRPFLPRPLPALLLYKEGGKTLALLVVGSNLRDPFSSVIQSSSWCSSPKAWPPHFHRLSSCPGNNGFLFLLILQHRAARVRRDLPLRHGRLLPLREAPGRRPRHLHVQVCCLPLASGSMLASSFQTQCGFDLLIPGSCVVIAKQQRGHAVLQRGVQAAADRGGQGEAPAEEARGGARAVHAQQGEPAPPPPSPPSTPPPPPATAAAEARHGRQPLGRRRLRAGARAARLRNERATTPRVPAAPRRAVRARSADRARRVAPRRAGASRSPRALLRRAQHAIRNPFGFRDRLR